jgi:hypothetical protein
MTSLGSGETRRRALPRDPRPIGAKFSRRICGDLAGGQGLAAVCHPELKKVIDRTQQISDWTRRPLSDAQIAYAALDVEVLVRVVHPDSSGARTRPSRTIMSARARPKLQCSIEKCLSPLRDCVFVPDLLARESLVNRE